jgi:DNA polymerase III delta prime subunit
MKENLSKRLNYHLWVEKFRPLHVKDMVLPAKMKSSLLKMIEEKEIPNLLLHSSTPGSGKTTLMKALCNDIGADYLYINVSSESSIDVLRTTISRFASTRSMEGSLKVVQMDECDGAGAQLQLGLRAAIEQFHKSCRFILTANHVNKIINPVRSRCQEFDMNYTDSSVVKEMKPKIVKHISNMLSFQKIVPEEGVLDKLIEAHYPDMRKMVQICQQFAKDGVLTDEIFKYQTIDTEFYELILNKKLIKARQFVIEHGYDYDDLYSKLFKEFIEMIPKTAVPQTIITLADYQYKNAFVVDKELNFAACLVEVMSNI